MSNQATLSAASNDRKARLAQLKSLKRKQAPTTQDDSQDARMSNTDPTQDIDEKSIENLTNPPVNSLKRKSPSSTPEPQQHTNPHLSGRNYDTATRAPKLGFETDPSVSSAQPTVEAQAARLALETKTAHEEEEKADKPLDLFKLQPKRPNWDLKRDLERKLKGFDVRTDNAIARLVRERVRGAQEREKDKGGVEGERVGMEGNTLVEVMHQREREEAEEEKREEDEDREMEDGV